MNNSILDRGRLQEIARLRLHEERIDEILQRYVAQAAQEFDLPIGLVSIVLDHAQKFSASHGLTGWLQESQGTPVEWSFCANSVATGEPFIVPDAEEHPSTQGNPLVAHDNVKCYAGAPMITKNGYVIGNFCVIGDHSRTFTDAEVYRLQEYAKLVVDHVERLVEA